MKNVIKFLLFLIYATIIFLIPNNLLLICPFIINLLAFVILKVATKTKLQKIAKKAIKNLLKFFPFIFLTFIINCLLDTYINATWMALKLLLVCNITFIYSQTTTFAEVAKTVRIICTPLKLFKINPEEIEVLVAIGLSMIPILKKELIEVKEACKAKNIKFSLSNIKIILSKSLTSFLKRVNEIDEALVEKGYNY